MTRRLLKDQVEEKAQRVEILVCQELVKGTIISYGYRLLHKYFKSQEHIVA